MIAAVTGNAMACSGGEERKAMLFTLFKEKMIMDTFKADMSIYGYIVYVDMLELFACTTCRLWVIGDGAMIVRLFVGLVRQNGQLQSAMVS